ncbi:hypothetical protein DLM86_01440 [Paenibacillus flagellatus]|uniref:Uncharacterized protein n=1 Tax=Paenibacillus flagellatus TaxID=2211139 RepID=A0A2V5KD34_9BACL|nr:hypothetical protein DLM86_01440 [Paenibacillus flagellatus]
MERYHYSEEPDIAAFVPRPAPADPGLPPVVYAIDRERAPHYWFPRDCPRVIYAKGERTSEADRRALFGDTAASKVIAVENGWLERIRETKLYVYTFAGDSFRLLDGTAGYYVSEETVVPLRVEPVGDLLAKLLAEPLELRFMPCLHRLRDTVVASTADFSIIRFRNASPRIGC